MSTASTSSSNGPSSFHSRPHSPAYHHPRQNNTPLHQHRHQNHQHHLQNHAVPKHSSTSTSPQPPTHANAHAHAHRRPSGPNKRSIASTSGLVASTKIKGMKSPEKRERERDRKRERQVGYHQQDLDLTRDTVQVDEHVGGRVDKVGGMEERDYSSGVERGVRDQAGGAGTGWQVGKEDDRPAVDSYGRHGSFPPTPTSAIKFGSSTDSQLLPETPTRTPRTTSRNLGSSAILPQTPTSPVRAITGVPPTSPKSLGYSFPTFKSSLSPPVIQDQNTGRGEAGAEQENAGRTSLWLNKSEGGKKRDHREVELGSREGSPVGDIESEKVQKDRGERTASWPRANGIDQGALPSTSRPRSDLGPMLTEQPPHHGFQGSKSDSHIPAPPNAAPERPRSIPSQPPPAPAAQMQNHPPHPRRMYAYNATSAEEEARRAILVDACEGLSSLCSQWHGSEYNKLKFGEKGRSRLERYQADPGLGESYGNRTLMIPLVFIRCSGAILSLDDRRSAACSIDHDGSSDV